MSNIPESLRSVNARIEDAARRFGRDTQAIGLIAVCKRKPAEAVREAFAAGQRAFGENHLQEALPKMDALADLDIEWHFIGPIQSNKTRPIASRFDWVHSVDRLKIAQRLSDQRATTATPLNVCVQVNISAEPTKSGVALDEVAALAHAVDALPRIALRGLMAIPRAHTGLAAQRAPFRLLRDTLEELNRQGLRLDTLSMGMSADMDAAIAEGATMVRIGTAIFGARAPHAHT